MGNRGLQPPSINIQSQVIVIFLSLFVGLIAIFIDLLLDYIVVGTSSYAEFMNVEIMSGQIITRRFWVILFPIMGLLLYYLILSKRIDIYQKEVKMADLLANAKENIVIYNKDDIIQVNDSFISTLGYTRQELDTMKITDFFPDYQQTETHNEGVYNWITKDGDYVNVEVVSTGISFEDNKMIIANDITEKTRLLKEKEKLQEQIDQDERMNLVGQLAGGIAHDFNNQLSIIMGNAELLGMQYNESDDEKAKIEQIIQTAKRSAELTEQLLTISRNKTIEYRSNQLHNILKDVISMSNRVFPKTIDIEDHFTNSELLIKGDEAHLFNAILNIFLNAKDAMPNGGKLKIRTSKTKISQNSLKELGYPLNSGNYAKLIIEDNGIGMDQQIAKQVFDPFFTTKQTGTGLGLSRVYSIIRSHKGWISVSSKKGIGTSFEIILPISQDKLKEDAKQLPEIGLTDTYNCLIIDDELLIREMLSEYLSSIGCQISMSGEVIDAIAYYQDNFDNLDLIFLDVNMPVINGWGVIKKMKEINPDIANIVLLSGSIELDNKKLKEYEDQILAVISKPFNQHDLISTIKSELETKKPSV